jgi:hypothetical protein
MIPFEPDTVCTGEGRHRAVWPAMLPPPSPPQIEDIHWEISATIVKRLTQQPLNQA